MQRDASRGTVLLLDCRLLHYLLPNTDKMICGNISRLVKARYSFSSLFLPLINDFFVIVLSDTLKIAAIGMFIIFAALNADAVSISIVLHPMFMIVSI